MRVLLGGAAVDLMVGDDVISLVERSLEQREGHPTFVGSANLDHLIHFGAAGDTHQLGEHWSILADGMPVVWMARRLTGRRWPQLAGSALLPELLALADRSGASVAFLGGSTSTLERLRQVLAQRWPSLKLAGLWAPARAVIDHDASSRALAREVRSTSPDLLVVGLGKPRQELWLERYGEATGAHVGLAFGAAADFLAGTASRAPRWMQRAGLEWFHRLVREPSRLWRRYLVQGPVALWRLLRHSSAGGTCA